MDDGKEKKIIQNNLSKTTKLKLLESLLQESFCDIYTDENYWNAYVDHKPACVVFEFLWCFLAYGRVYSNVYWLNPNPQIVKQWNWIK